MKKRITLAMSVSIFVASLFLGGYAHAKHNKHKHTPPSPEIAPVMSCEDIENLQFTDLKFGEPVTITSASIVLAGALPEYCDVRGTIWPEIEFDVKLPTDGNGKLYYVGGGGYNGSISENAMSPGLLLGYATAGSNGGHNGFVGDGSFAYDNPDESNPNWNQKIDDFGYRSVHETANLAKKIIKAYYGSSPKKSYFVGCSNGGREGLQEAERYPDDFDGIIVGSPAIAFTGAPFRGLWDSQASAGLLPGTAAIPAAKLSLLADAVYDKCDGIDGLEDGLIDDPRLCTFDPLNDLPACPDEEDYSDCFTLAQRTAIKKIYDGPENSVGAWLYVGTPPGGEIEGPGFSGIASGWLGSVVSPVPGLPGDFLAPDFFKYMAFLPWQDPAWSWETLNFDTDMARIYTSGITDRIDAASFDVNSAPNAVQLAGLKRFRAQGGKLIQYHGWADTLVSPFVSYKFYDAVLASMGDARTKSFYKLYMVPGMFHCGGGVGCSNIDWFTPLVNWVEKGIEPEEIIGARPAYPDLDLSARTRPMCPYPEVAGYSGAGSIDDATNFTCVGPIRAKVRVEPETLTLGSDGEFTASIMLFKRGYYAGDIDVSTVTCGGAPVVEGTVSGGKLTAKFNIQDLVGVLPGDRVTLTIYGAVGAMPFEGSDTVRVNGWAWKTSRPLSSVGRCK
ncbi:MAG: tannase/feruloyl esterase family alpha/beta hydrolase [Deltaproteobacteria bacterium]